MKENLLFTLKVISIIVVGFVLYNLRITIVTDVDKSCANLPSYKFIELHNFRVDTGFAIGRRYFDEGLYIINVEFDTWWMERL